uniref:Uncharacterized protein n=1 Tax=Leclercia adecarboxylata TaxID=83655 RepID=A0A7D5GDZ4_9ENTR|nr:hypothetical protein [Leclercia adecarboxylata]
MIRFTAYLQISGNVARRKNKQGAFFGRRATGDDPAVKQYI